jgi:hypothetical protein
MPQPSPPLFYTRGSSAPAERVFGVLNQLWTEQYLTSGAKIDIVLDGPPAAWIASVGEFPCMSHAERRKLVAEIMEIICGHAELMYCDAEGHA